MLLPAWLPTLIWQTTNNAFIEVIFQGFFGRKAVISCTKLLYQDKSGSFWRQHSYKSNRQQVGNKPIRVSVMKTAKTVGVLESYHIHQPTSIECSWNENHFYMNSHLLCSNGKG